MEVADNKNHSRYLACERKGVFLLLMMSAGMMGAYTYNLRGGMFCNAQTANVVLMAMAFCTNHIRQIGTSIATYIRHREKGSLKRGFSHFLMVVFFFAGGVLLTALCDKFQEKVIWVATLPLLINFVILAHADIFEEHDMLDEKPAGH